MISNDSQRGKPSQESTWADAKFPSVQTFFALPSNLEAESSRTVHFQPKDGRHWKTQTLIISLFLMISHYFSLFLTISHYFSFSFPLNSPCCRRTCAGIERLQFAGESELCVGTHSWWHMCAWGRRLMACLTKSSKYSGLRSFRSLNLVSYTLSMSLLYWNFIELSCQDLSST